MSNLTTSNRNTSNLTIELREEPSQAIAGMPYLSLQIDRDVTVAVLDLPQLLGFTPIDATAIDLHIAILQIGGVFLGLGVTRIGRVLRFTEPEIVSPIQLPQIKLPRETMPFLRGWIAQPQGLTNNLYLLDAEAIALTNFNL